MNQTGGSEEWRLSSPLQIDTPLMAEIFVLPLMVRQLGSQSSRGEMKGLQTYEVPVDVVE